MWFYIPKERKKESEAQNSSALLRNKKMSTFWFVFLFFLHFRTKLVSSQLQNSTSEYFEVGRPLPTDSLTPSCTVEALRHSFATTLKRPPFTTIYSPPNCSSPWSRVVLEFRGNCTGKQSHRIAGLWLNGSELLRTSTPQPIDSGATWKFRKDITSYSSILSQSNISLAMMLENVVNHIYTGVYHIEVDFLFYNITAVTNNDVNQNFARKIGFRSESAGLESEKLVEGTLGATAEDPANLIIPISDNGKKGFWFTIESEAGLLSKDILIPKNTRRAVLELYASFHDNDESWYSNLPNSYIVMNNITTGRTNGAYREIFVTIDGEFVGSEVPFPVIYSGGINPLFWKPVVAIGAFNLPSYHIEVTPFLGMLLDGKNHTFSIGVTEAISYWLVDANLHLWIDCNFEQVEAKYYSTQSKPSLEIEEESQFKKLDGKYKIEAERETKSVGWVKWCGGNYTTTYYQSNKFKNEIQFTKDGTHKEVIQKIKIKKELTIENEGRKVSRTQIEREYPLEVITEVKPGGLFDTAPLIVTKVSHGFNEESSQGHQQIKIKNSQDSDGWKVAKNNSVVYGKANTHQSFVYKDDSGSFSRNVEAKNGILTKDNNALACEYCANE